MLECILSNNRVRNDLYQFWNRSCFSLVICCPILSMTLLIFSSSMALATSSVSSPTGSSYSLPKTRILLPFSMGFLRPLKKFTLAMSFFKDCRPDRRGRRIDSFGCPKVQVQLYLSDDELALCLMVFYNFRW